uniref:Uncharacterized protein n=1 Tax=Bionectria ochroleuca TaxID=29856 RepID=A0A8H7NMD8_BIOOC
MALQCAVSYNAEEGFVGTLHAAFSACHWFEGPASSSIRTYASPRTPGASRRVNLLLEHHIVLELSHTPRVPCSPLDVASPEQHTLSGNHVSLKTAPPVVTHT